MRSNYLVPVVIAFLIFLTIGTALGSEPSYRIQRGDTLWDLSGRFWNDETTWPELWALNPHFRNPHWINPGDPIFLKHTGPTGQLVRLPVERLKPGVGTAPGTAADQRPDVGGSGAGGALGPSSATARTFRLAREQAQDFVSSGPIPRLGTIDNVLQTKVAYGTEEDVEIALEPGAGLQAGDWVTVFTDERTVVHPTTGKAEGRYVEIRGHMLVRAVSGRRAVGRLLETYETVKNGFGVMAYREPVREVALKPARVGVEGVILTGKPGLSIFATEDGVILNRGSIHGLDSGVLLDIPTWEGQHAAQGLVDVETPLARLLVVSVQDTTSTGVIVDSRAAVEAGDRFVVAPFSP